MKSNNKLIVYIIILLCIMTIQNCKMIEETTGTAGSIEGILVKVNDSNYGIDGKAIPLAEYFYMVKNAKYLINEFTKNILLKTYTEGDVVSFIFRIVGAGDPDVDWTTTIAIESN